MPFLQTDNAARDGANNFVGRIERHEDTHFLETLSQRLRCQHGVEKPIGSIAVTKFFERFAQARKNSRGIFAPRFAYGNCRSLSLHRLPLSCPKDNLGKQAPFPKLHIGVITGVLFRLSATFLPSGEKDSFVTWKQIPDSGVFSA